MRTKAVEAARTRTVQAQRLSDPHSRSPAARLIGTPHKRTISAREDRHPGGRPPFCPRQAQAMSRAISPVTGKPYGLAAVCRVWRLARSGVYRHLSASPPAQRRGPLGAMSDEALTTAIRGVLAARAV